MKAAVLKSFGSPLSIEILPDPVLGTGEVVVDVIATSVLSYMNEIISGERKYLIKLPVAPGSGAIGRVRAVGPDSTRLKIGDWVCCDPTVRSRDGGVTPEITLQGLSARGEAGMRLQSYFHNGSFAEQMLIPTENAVPIGPLNENEASSWCATNLLLVPFGGFLKAKLQAGETVLISGATGNFGTAAVVVALAMGAGCVVAVGRNEKVLKDLITRFGSRVRTVKLTGNEKVDTELMKSAQPLGIDLVLDILPPTVGTETVRAALMAVRPYGRIVLMGGVGMLGGAGLDLPYPWIMRNCISIHGQWMYPPDAISQVVNLIHSGLIDLKHFEMTDFSLDKANEAVAHAAKNSGPFKMTVIRPN